MGLLSQVYMLRSETINLFSELPISSNLSQFKEIQLVYKVCNPSWVHDQKVWWTVLWTGLATRPTLLSKDTAFYLKICLALGLTKLHLFVRTNFSPLQSRLGPFSESSDQGLLVCQPQNVSLSNNLGFYSRFKQYIYVSRQTLKK